MIAPRFLEKKKLFIDIGPRLFGVPIERTKASGSYNALTYPSHLHKALVHMTKSLASWRHYLWVTLQPRELHLRELYDMGFLPFPFYREPRFLKISLL